MESLTFYILLSLTRADHSSTINYIDNEI